MSRIREEALKDPARWPLLVRATEDEQQAHNVKVEWHLPVSYDEVAFIRADTVITTNFNYMQIFRWRRIEDVLDDVETALKYGKRQFVTNDLLPISFMGGALDLLGHVPTDEDTLRLWILSDLKEYTQDYPKRSEWICEVSLEAR